MSIFGTLIEDCAHNTVKGLYGYLIPLFIPAVFAVLASCAEKKPEGILSREEMVRIMGKMYIAEEKINQLAIPRDSSKKIFTVIEGKVFEDAAVADSVFKRSFDYYMEHPKEMELIYTALVDTLHLREQRAPFRPDQE